MHWIDLFPYSSHVWALLVETDVGSAPTDRFLLLFPSFLVLISAFQAPSPGWKPDPSPSSHSATKIWLKHIKKLIYYQAPFLSSLLGSYLMAARPRPFPLAGVWYCLQQFAVDVCHKCGEMVLWSREITEPAVCHLLEPELLQTGRSKPGPSGTLSYFQG